MNFQGNFRTIAEVDVAALRERVTAFADFEWAGATFGNANREAGGAVATIALVFDPDLRHSHPTRLPIIKDLEAALVPTLAAVAAYFEEGGAGRRLTGKFGLGYFVRAVLESMKPGLSKDSAPDTAFSPVHSHRVYVPVVTNPDVRFTVGEETVHLPAGVAFEINNRRERAIVNGGGAACIHLVLDFVLPGEQCCCGAKRHPGTVCSPAACHDTDRLVIACDCYPAAAS